MIAREVREKAVFPAAHSPRSSSTSAPSVLKYVGPGAQKQAELIELPPMRTHPRRQVQCQLVYCYLQNLAL
jgi:hypothetical protein